MQRIRRHKWIILILFLGAFLRLYGISRGDPVNDEALMAFRAVGMIDFDQAAWQTTPFEWFDPLVRFSPTVPFLYQIGTGIPWWAHLSWHDHPPLVFFVQHIFISIFGEHVWAFRLPSAFLGVFSVYLLYLIGRRLYDEHVGLLSALLYALTVNGVYISRTGMQEPYVIFFILITLYYFLCSFEKEKCFVATGIFLGLGTLAKYTTFFVASPIIIAYLLIFQRKTFYNKKFWLGVLAFFVLVSPIILYNIELYRTVHHFDFQLSVIFQQAHPAWQVEPGKDIGSIAERVRVLVPRMIATNSWLFLSVFAVSILGFLFSFFRDRRKVIKKHSFLILSLACVVALLLAIGPSYRFLTMLVPFIALCVGYLLSALYISPAQYKKLSPLHHTSRSGEIIARTANRKQFFVLCGLTLFFMFEIYYSWNNQIAYYPIGPAPWLASKVRYENYNWGYNALTEYFEKEFQNKVPALTFDLRYQFLNDLRDTALARGLRHNDTRYPAIVVYDGIFDQVGKLWSLDRLHIYHAWPIVSLKEYQEYLSENGTNFFDQAGFKNYYFITPAGVVAPAFSQLVRGLGLVEIKNPHGETAVLVYKKGESY